jgi:succinoglycan biosynthesis protein ExoA
MLPFISVIIPVRNERMMLPRLLDQMVKQSYPARRFEILVVDGESTDGTADLVRRRYSRGRVSVRVIDNPKKSSAAGRNAGLRAASGDVILFIDGACMLPSRNLLEDTAAILDRTGVACLCRPQPLLAPAATHTGEAIAQTWTNWLVRGRHPKTCDLKQAGFVDPVCSGFAYLRRVFYKVGLFDEGLDACEDIEFNTRVRKAGFRAYSDPRFALWHQPCSTMRKLFEQMIRYGRGRKQLTRRHPDSFSSGAMAPLGLMTSMLFACVAWAMLPAASATVASLPAAIFAVLAFAATVQVFVAHGFATACKAPLIFLTTYLGIGVGLLSDMLVPAKLDTGDPTDLLLPGQELLPAEPVDRAA